jgi:transketolase
MMAAPMTALSEMAGIAADIRGEVLRMSHARRTPHVGSCLSCIDLLVALYWGWLRVDPARPEDPLRDRFILSKGHAAVALYATLARRGFFDPSWLDDYATDGSPLGEHPSVAGVPGVEWATGSLGHGLAVAAGMAVAGRLQGQDHRCVALLSDGECNEGSVWESAMHAAAMKLGRLVVIVDYNKWQATGRSREIMALEPLAGKWRDFGWDAVEIDGHDPGALLDALSGAALEAHGAPRAVIAHTVKGRGVSFMEDDNHWHYRIPTADEVAAARVELEAALRR